ncbi:MAG TPA: DUF4012 domain-containing protein [Acidimicrobiales bacterium]|nr:DUF4012 domain-containing protein [Acidimicrobiales bacterium]
MADRPRRSTRTLPAYEGLEWPLVAALAVASAVAGALSGAHPTGTPVVDPLYDGLFAGVVVAAAAVAGRATLLWLAAVVAGFSRGYIIFPALAGLITAFASVLTRRPVRALNALSAALAVQAALRLPHISFQGGSALVAGVAVAPCLIHATWSLPRAARLAVLWTFSAGIVVAIALSVPVAVEAALSHSDASSGTTAAQEALRAVGDGDSAGGQAQLQAAKADFGSVANRVGAWWTAGARIVPVVSQQRKAVLTGAEVARDVSASAQAEAGHIDFARLHFRGNGVDLAQVADLKGPLGRVDTVLTTGLRELRSADSGWLVQPLASRLDLLTTKVAKAQRSASVADQAAGAAPSILGGEGARHYMVMVMDTSESRGLGGLVVSYGVLTADNGHLKLDSFQDISKLNAAVGDHGGLTLTGPADFVARYGQNPARYAQNVTYSPDLPTVTDVMGQIYAKAFNGGFDGALVIDPRGIASLLRITGGVQVAGIGPMNADNAEQVLAKGQYAAYPSPTQQTVRRAALTDAMKEVISRLTSMPLPGPRSMTDVLDPAVVSGDLLFWSTHPSDQPFLTRIGMAGEFPRAAGGDLLGVVSSNGGANKMDAYLQRTVTDQVQYDRSNGRVKATLQVALHNEAPAQGLSSEVIGSYAGSGIPPGTNRVWLTVYSPLGLTGAEVDGKKLTTGTYQELGLNVHSAYIDVPAGATNVVTFHLEGSVAPGGYVLHLYRQPRALPDRVTVRVSDGGGSKSWNPPGASEVSVFSPTASRDKPSD